MRRLISALVAVGVMLQCLVGVGVVLIYVVTGNHGASWSDVGLMLPFLAWGVVAGAAVLGKASWSRKCMLTWALASGVALGACAVAGALPWSTVGLIAAGLALACLATQGRHRAAG